LFFLSPFAAETGYSAGREVPPFPSSPPFPQPIPFSADLGLKVAPLVISPSVLRGWNLQWRGFMDERIDMLFM
jgi:hypothetical protein